MKKITLLLLAGLLIACGPSQDEIDNTGEEPKAVVLQELDMEAVVRIIQTRCATCHSAQPTDDIFKVAPSNVKLDNIEQMQRYASRIYVRTVASKTMPFMNKTNMTDEERSIIGQWIKAGAPNK